MGKGSFAESVFDNLMGGVIGAIIAIYYAKMIPEPTGDGHQLKLILSLIFVIGMFAAIKLASNIRERSQESESLLQRLQPQTDRGDSHNSLVLVCILAVFALGSFLLEREKKEGKENS